MPIRLICSTDGPLCLRSATTSFWHNRCRRGPSTPSPIAEARLRVLDDGRWPFLRGTCSGAAGSAILPQRGNAGGTDGGGRAFEGLVLPRAQARERDDRRDAFASRDHSARLVAHGSLRIP